jgi:hypothetical protein
MENIAMIAALVVLIAAEAYFVATTLLDFFPFNNIRESTSSERRREVAVNSPGLVLPIILLCGSAAAHLPVLALAAGALELVIGLGGVLLWWSPYLTGRSVPWATAGTDESWRELHGRIYAKTLIVLPPIGGRPRPNVEHMILHALIIAGGVLAIVYGAQ